GSVEVTNLLCDGIENVLGAKFAVEPDPKKAAALMIAHIEKKRIDLLGESIEKENEENELCMS
ncbi:MAG TPA: hypothetical protein VHO70_04550, partial [Chitinispirillaceae bacterium]|nr:hypothetical protein [Chitinispirillaceae bacterium]